MRFFNKNDVKIFFMFFKNDFKKNDYRYCDPNQSKNLKRKSE